MVVVAIMVVVANCNLDVPCVTGFCPKSRDNKKEGVVCGGFEIAIATAIATVIVLKYRYTDLNTDVNIQTQLLTTVIRIRLLAHQSWFLTQTQG